MWKGLDPGVTFVAEGGGGIVGFSCAGPERSGDPTYRGEVYAIYILRAFQDQGLGRQLFGPGCGFGLRPRPG